MIKTTIKRFSFLEQEIKGNKAAICAVGFNNGVEFAVNILVTPKSNLIHTLVFKGLKEEPEERNIVVDDEIVEALNSDYIYYFLIMMILWLKKGLGFPPVITKQSAANNIDNIKAVLRNSIMEQTVEDDIDISENLLIKQV
jgi:hypothetical protein